MESIQFPGGFTPPIGMWTIGEQGGDEFWRGETAAVYLGEGGNDWVLEKNGIGL
jgi:hypothetical protein